MITMERRRGPYVPRVAQINLDSESASLNLTQTFQKFRQQEPPQSLGRDRDWAIDLVPKFLMANGELTNMLVVRTSWGLITRVSRTH